MYKATFDDVVCVSRENGNHLGKYKPSTDSPTHLELYNHYPEIGGIVHTHSMYATAWAQSCMPIPCLGTTHGDYWDGEVPVCAQFHELQSNECHQRAGHRSTGYRSKQNRLVLLKPGPIDQKPYEPDYGFDCY